MISFGTSAKISHNLELPRLQSISHANLPSTEYGAARYYVGHGNFFSIQEHTAANAACGSDCDLPTKIVNYYPQHHHRQPTCMRQGNHSHARFIM
jgi:hypothetical protein